MSKLSPRQWQALSRLSSLQTVNPILASQPELLLQKHRLLSEKGFCGFSFAEIAPLESLSERTVQEKWEKARIYLHRNISRGLADLRN